MTEVTPLPIRKCKTCVYVQRHSPYGERPYLVCRRFPPTAMRINDYVSLAEFPIVLADCWCWEYKENMAERILETLQELTKAPTEG